MRNINIAPQNGPTQEATAVFATASDGTMTQGVLAQDLMTELMGVVPVLGGAKVTVGFAGTGAFCDKNLSYVNVPALPPARIIPMQIARQVRGFAAHESAHIAFTDPSIPIVDDNGEHNALLHTTWNCIEDYMIERNWLLLYPGAKKNFAATEIHCCRSYLENYGKDPDVALDLRRVGPLALTWMRAMHFGLGTQSSRDCFSTLPGEFQRRVTGWFTDIIDVEDTAECLAKAKEIYADIMANPFDPANPPANPFQAPNQGASGQGQAGSGNGGPGKGAKGPGASTGAPSQANGSYNGPAPLPVSADLQDVLADHADRENPISTAHVLSDSQYGPAAEILGDEDGHKVSQEVMNKISSTTSAITMQLRRALKTKSKTRFKTGRMDGTIDGSRIATAMTGGLDYHRRKIKGEEIDTAVSILVDCSGSMNGQELEICQQMSLAMESAFAGTRIKHEIIGYTTADIDDADEGFKTMVESHKANGGDGLFQAVSLYEFRGFGQSHNAALRSIGNMARSPTSGTPTSEGILAAHDRLARRREKRHVMFVLTDGSSDDSVRTKAAVEAVEACNVSVIGVGICSTSVEHEFNQHVVINDINDLPAAMMSKITAMLLGDQNLTAISGAAARKVRDRNAA